MEKDLNTPKVNRDEKISRKEAIGKVGKYAAFTATTMMLLMSPASADNNKKSPNKPKPHKP